MEVVQESLNEANDNVEFIKRLLATVEQFVYRYDAATSALLS